jgi:hypothetical protein
MVFLAACTSQMPIADPCVALSLSQLYLQQGPTAAALRMGRGSWLKQKAKEELHDYILRLSEATQAYMRQSDHRGLYWLQNMI